MQDLETNYKNDHRENDGYAGKRGEETICI